MTEDIQSMRTLEMKDEEDLDISNSCIIDNKFSAYIPKRRFLKEKKNVLYVIAILILFIVTIIIISIKLFNTEPSINLSHALLLSSDRNLLAVDPNSLRHQFLRQTKRNIIALDVNVNESILWIERNSSTITYLDNNIGTPFTQKWEPQAIAVDYITNKLYIIDKLAETLNVIDMRYNYIGVVRSDLVNPYDIVLDPVVGVLFIIQLYDSILRCDLDGTSIIEMAKNKLITAITINRKLKRIYWLTDFKSIETSNYDGVSHYIVHHTHTGDITSLVFHDDKLFWLSSTPTSDKTIVYSCKTNGLHCDDLLERTLSFSTRHIKVAPELKSTTRKNPCASNNGDCEHLCLLNTYGFTCACKIGFQLNRNMKKCDPITNFLLFSVDRYFRGRSGLGQTFVDAFSPTRFTVLSLEKKNRIDFDRGWAFDEVYFTDDTCIHRLNLTDGNQTKIYHLSNIKSYHIEGLAIDRGSDNFYFCKKSNVNKDTSIVIITIKEGRVLEKTLYSTQNHINTHSLVLNQEFLFYGERIDVTQIIVRDLINKRYDQNVGNDIYAFAIDYDENVLYWIEFLNVCSVKIEYDHLKAQSRHCFSVRLIGDNIRTFYVYKEWIYINDDKNIWRFNKKTGSDMITLISNNERKSDFQISGVQVFDLKALNEEKNNTCATNNGGCDQFCSSGKQIICACRDGMTDIQDDHCE